MPIVDISKGQIVHIPALKLNSGNHFEGVVKATDGEHLIIDLASGALGGLPLGLPAQHEFELIWQGDGGQRVCPVSLSRKSDRRLVAHVELKERRESQRVAIDLALTYEAVPAEDVGEVAEQTLSRLNSSESYSEASALLSSVEDPIDQLRQEVWILREAIYALSRRIEDLTEAVESGGHGDRAHIEHPLMVSDCSNTGIGFIGEAPHSEGQYLKLKLRLPTVPIAEIDCLGVVVRCRKLDPPEENPGALRFDFGVRFTHIHEPDRERIIQYMFKVQRRMLRDRKEAREEMSELER